MDNNLGALGAIVAFIALTAGGILIFGGITQFVLGCSASP